VNTGSAHDMQVCYFAISKSHFIHCKCVNSSAYGCPLLYSYLYICIYHYMLVAVTDIVHLHTDMIAPH